MAAADRTQQILPGGQSAAPFSYTVPASFAFSLLGVRATFDGASAAGAFLPCVQLVSDSGQVMAQSVGSSVAAGDSADVTFAPFLGEQASGGGTDPLAIHFNTNPQPGHTVFWQTDQGVDLADRGATSTGFRIESGDGSGGGGFVSLSTDDGEVFIGSTDITERVGTAGSWQLQSHNADVMIQADDGATVTLHLSAGNLFVTGLPTADPGVSGAVWNNAGVLNVSP